MVQLESRIVPSGTIISSLGKNKAYDLPTLPSRGGQFNNEIMLAKETETDVLHKDK